jgi:hypothetical protein
VLFVPTFFVVVQRFENGLKARKKKTPEPAMAPVTRTDA